MTFLVVAVAERHFRAGLRTARKVGGIHTHAARLALAGAIAAVATFALVSLEPTNVAPSTPVIVLAASVAVSALVLPGLSGSFLLLALARGGGASGRLEVCDSVGIRAHAAAAPATSGEPMVEPTIRISLNWTLSPASAASFSTRSTSPA